MTVKDHYQVLGIPRNCSEDDIKKAYRSLAKQYHPDKNDDAGAEEKFKEISGAYEVLKDSDKKRVYDLQKEGEELRAKRAKEQSTSKPANNASSRTSAFNNGTFFFKSPGAFSFTQNGTKFKFSFFDDNDEDIADDSRKKDKDNNKDKNKTKKKKKDPPSFPRPWEHHATSSNDTRPEWNNDFATESDEEDEVRGVPRMSHGFPFRKFGDPFKQMDDMFKDFFKDPFFDMGVSTRRNQRGLQEKSETKPKKEKKPMEDMYDWSKPMFNKKRSHFDDEDYDYSYESDEDISKYLFPCSFCGRKFHSVDVHKHEETCKKIHHGHSKNPEASESPGPAKKNSKSKGNSDDKDDDSERYHSPSPPPRSHNWRQEHEELKSHVRNARKAAKSQKEAKAQKPVKTNCPWCGREFDTDVAERHIPFCKERTQSHGEPATPRGNPTARDYGSKSYTAREYARNIPKPKTSNDTPFRPSPSRTGRDFMDEPYTYTGSGLHPHTRPTRTKATGGSTSHLGGVSGKGYTTPRASASTSFISSSCPSSYNRSYVPTNTRYITTGYYPHASSSVSGNNAIRSSYSSYIPAASLSSSIRVPSYSPSTSSLSLGQGTYIPKYRSSIRIIPSSSGYF